MTTKKRIQAVLDTVRGALTEPQGLEVESNLQAGEERLALEFLVDFLLEADAVVTTATKTEIQSLATALRSTRRGPELLPVAG